MVGSLANIDCQLDISVSDIPKTLAVALSIPCPVEHWWACFSGNITARLFCSKTTSRSDQAKLPNLETPTDLSWASDHLGWVNFLLRKFNNISIAGVEFHQPTIPSARYESLTLNGTKPLPTDRVLDHKADSLPTDHQQGIATRITASNCQPITPPPTGWFLIGV